MTDYTSQFNVHDNDIETDLPKFTDELNTVLYIPNVGNFIIVINQMSFFFF